MLTCSFCCHSNPSVPAFFPASSPLSPSIPLTEEEMEQAEESVDSNKFENDDRKLFVGGLTWETTVDQLKAYFEKYGTVKVCWRLQYWNWLFRVESIWLTRIIFSSLLLFQDASIKVDGAGRWVFFKMVKNWKKKEFWHVFGICIFILWIRSSSTLFYCPQFFFQFARFWFRALRIGGLRGQRKLINDHVHKKLKIVHWRLAWVVVSFYQEI